MSIIKMLAFRLYLAVLQVLFTGVVLEALNSDRINIDFINGLFAGFNYFLSCRKNKRGIQKFALIPLVVA
jgi:hypothetical protein